MNIDMKKSSRRWCDQSGVTIVLVTALTIMFVAFVALSVDIAHLYVVQNELQNAADAGALAGARQLVNVDGTINTYANQIAHDAAIDNQSDNVAVEVSDPNSNTGDVQRGHWSFTSKTFTPNPLTEQTILHNVTSQELDLNTNFINGVRVRTRRQQTPAVSFFARIFGFQGFAVAAEAVAYIGFAGSPLPHTLGAPIALCEHALGYPYDCTVARWINDTGGGMETAAWTDLTECTPMEPFGGGSANTGIIEQAVSNGCSGAGANTGIIHYGSGIRTTNGMVEGQGRAPLWDCWSAATGRTSTWLALLPVIDCQDPNVPNGIGPCNKMLGVAYVRILWITEEGDGQVTVPTSMEGYGEGSDAVPSWSSSEPNVTARWNDFANHFNIRNTEGDNGLNPETGKPYRKTIFFAPSCEVHMQQGTTGAKNFGVLAEIPKLVN